MSFVVSHVWPPGKRAYRRDFETFLFGHKTLKHSIEIPFVVGSHRAGDIANRQSSVAEGGNL